MGRLILSQQPTLRSCDQDHPKRRQSASVDELFCAFLAQRDPLRDGLRMSGEELVASATFLVFLVLRSRARKMKRVSTLLEQLCPSEHRVSTLDELRDTIPSGFSGNNIVDAIKVLPYLDDQMQGFVARSPFLQLATSDCSGLPYVSPKGDGPGFVEVVKRDGKGVALLIPDRPGNKLLFGLQNILDTARVGILFEIGGNSHTLRCGGSAALSRDPALLAKLAARGKSAKMVICVEIQYAFFHCAKAYIRSKLWRHESWPQKSEKFDVQFGPYFGRTKKEIDLIDASVQRNYGEIEESVAGLRDEPE